MPTDTLDALTQLGFPSTTSSLPMLPPGLADPRSSRSEASSCEALLHVGLVSSGDADQAVAHNCTGKETSTTKQPKGTGFCMNCTCPSCSEAQAARAEKRKQKEEKKDKKKQKKSK